jgi:hypothetical protein
MQPKDATHWSTKTQSTGNVRTFDAQSETQRAGKMPGIDAALAAEAD